MIKHHGKECEEANVHIKVNHSAVNQPDVNKVNKNLEQTSKQTKPEKNEALETEDQWDSRLRRLCGKEERSWDLVLLDLAWILLAVVT